MRSIVAIMFGAILLASSAQAQQEAPSKTEIFIEAAVKVCYAVVSTQKSVADTGPEVTALVEKAPPDLIPSHPMGKQGPLWVLKSDPSYSVTILEPKRNYCSVFGWGLSPLVTIDAAADAVKAKSALVEGKPGKMKGGFAQRNFATADKSIILEIDGLSGTPESQATFAHFARKK